MTPEEINPSEPQRVDLVDVELPDAAEDLAAMAASGLTFRADQTVGLVDDVEDVEDAKNAEAAPAVDDVVAPEPAAIPAGYVEAPAITGLLNYVGIEGTAFVPDAPAPEPPGARTPAEAVAAAAEAFLGSPRPPKRPALPASKPAPVEAPGGGDPIAALLAKAEESGNPALIKQVERVRQAVTVLEGMVAGHKKRTEVEQLIAELRQQLAEAEARLHELSGAGGPTKAAERGGNAALLREIRRWARENGWQCAPLGRIPRPVMEAYRGAHPEVSHG